MTPSEIISQLTPSEQDAVLRKFSFKSYVEQEMGEETLYRLGVWKRGYLKRGESILTPLGEDVARLLKKSRKSPKSPA